MKIDFRNPQLVAYLDGKPFSEIFGGFKPNGWMKSIMVELSFGGVMTNIEWTLELPYKDACTFLNNCPIDVSKNPYVSFQFGYPGDKDLWTPRYGGFALQFPKITFGTDTTITWTAVGVISWQTRAYTVPADFHGKNVEDIIIEIFKTPREIATREYLTTKFMEHNIKIDVSETSKPDQIPIYIDDAGNPLKKIKLDSMTNSTNNSWQFVTELLRKFNYSIADYGNYVHIFPTRPEDKEPVVRFQLYGETNTEKNIFGIEEFNIEIYEAFYLDAFRKVHAAKMATDSGEISITPVDTFKNQSAGNAAQAGRTKDMADKSAMIIGAAAVEWQKGGTVFAGTFGKDASFANAASCSMYGMPKIKPGDRVEVETGVKWFNKAWMCRSVTHTYDDSGWTTKFDFFLPSGETVSINQAAPEQNSTTKTVQDPKKVVAPKNQAAQPPKKTEAAPAVTPPAYSGGAAENVTKVDVSTSFDPTGVPSDTADTPLTIAHNVLGKIPGR